MLCPSRDRSNAGIPLEYCAGTLDPDQAAEFEKHAAGCAECGRLVAEQRALWQVLDEWSPAEISTDFDARLYARIEREQAASPWRQWFVWAWKPALLTAAACGVLAVGLWVRQTPPARPETVDVEQVEHALEDLDMLTPLPAAGNRI